MSQVNVDAYCWHRSRTSPAGGFRTSRAVTIRRFQVRKARTRALNIGTGICIPIKTFLTGPKGIRNLTDPQKVCLTIGPSTPWTPRARWVAEFMRAARWTILDLERMTYAAGGLITACLRIWSSARKAVMSPDVEVLEEEEAPDLEDSFEILGAARLNASESTWGPTAGAIASEPTSGRLFSTTSGMLGSRLRPACCV